MRHPYTTSISLLCVLQQEILSAEELAYQKLRGKGSDSQGELASNGSKIGESVSVMCVCTTSVGDPVVPLERLWGTGYWPSRVALVACGLVHRVENTW